MNIRSKEAANAACYKSQSFAYSLFFAPYQLRASDMDSITPTLARLFNVDLRFSETDPSHRTTPLFRVRQTTDVTFEGEVQWISFAVTFQDGPPSPCFMEAFKDFSM